MIKNFLLEFTWRLELKLKRFIGLYYQPFGLDFSFANEIDVN